jgi:hypothetical protein
MRATPHTDRLMASAKARARNALWLPAMNKELP